jgi:putative ABC transport system permease protein
VARILNLFRRRRDRLERDLDRELRYHVDRRVDDMMKNGSSEAEARRQAYMEFGGVAQVQEEVRETWIWRWLDALARDVRYAARSLTRSWGFTLGAAAILALAIGANTAIFSVVNTVLLQPLPYRDAERIVSVETFWTNTGRASQDVSGADFLDWQAQNDVFETMAASYGVADDVVVVGGRAVFANDQYVSPDYFAVFGQTASAGRLLTKEDLPAGDAQPVVAVVAHHWAVTHFGSDEAAIGKTIEIYGSAKQIVGVVAPGFRHPGATDIWAPWPMSDADRNLYNYHAVGRLKPGVELSRAQAQMRTIGDNLARQYPENRLKTVALVPLQERLTGSLQVTLWALMSAVAVVWLIACANVANLLLARAAGRAREIALRAALGAGRARVMRQLLTESCVLAGVAGLAGVLLASLLVRALVASSPATLPRLDEVRVDTTVPLFALGLSLLSTVIFGLAPALQASRLDLSDALKQGGSKGTASGASTRFRSALVVAEVALSVILLATAGLLWRSLQALQNVDLGFATERVLVAYTEYAVEEDRESIRARSRFYTDVLDRLRAVPGVSAAAGVAYLGMGREPRAPRDYFIQGRTEGQPGARPQAELHAITPDYFKTMQIPNRMGRDFDRTDTPDRPLVAIVNEALARAAFPGESPLGQRIRMNSRSPWMDIVGVVADTRWQDPSQPPPPVVFVPTTQDWGNSPSILARSSLDEASLAPTLRTLLHDADPTVPVRFETMEELFDSALAYPRFRTRVLGLFAGAAALLAAVGIFSVLAYLVGQRAREIAVRRAVGARTADVIRLVVGQGLRSVAVGLVLGLAGALALARLLGGLLYEIGPWDVRAYLGAVTVLGVVALLATVIPAIRAATISPLRALQED